MQTHAPMTDATVSFAKTAGLSTTVAQSVRHYSGAVTAYMEFGTRLTDVTPMEATLEALEEPAVPILGHLPHQVQRSTGHRASKEDRRKVPHG